MATSKLNEDTQDQIWDLLGNLQQIEKLKNIDLRILLDRIVRKYGVKVEINETLINLTFSFSYFTKSCS